VFTLRATAKLLKRLKVKPEAAPPASTTKLGDWYANLLYIQRQQLVLCVSEASLLPVIVRAAGKEPLAARLPAAVGDMLAALSVPAPIVDGELASMQQVTIAATASRTVLGSMNDFAWLLEGYWEPTASLLELALKVADAPCSPLKMGRPREVAVELLVREQSARHDGAVLRGLGR